MINELRVGVPRMAAWTLAAGLLSLAACVSTGAADGDAGARRSKQAPAPTAVEDADTVAYFAGGCFWGVEHFLEQIDGVAIVESGYMGGTIKDPTYEQVSSRTSGHYETVRVRFDSSRVSYEAVAKRFFEIHDPTQTDGQGPDIGPEYLSVVFYGSEEQKATAQSLIDRLEARGYDVATQLLPAQEFYLAEDYHQDYYAHKNKTPYCHSPVDRFGDNP